MINIGIYPDLESESVNSSQISDYIELKGTVILNRIIQAKRDDNAISILKNCRKALLSDFKYYEENKYSLNKIHADTSLTEEAKQLLKDTYENKPSDLECAKNKILSLLPEELYGKCPYCRVDSHETCDHYFPKSDYPEYSFYPLNLIPCCSFCNWKKGDKFYDSHNQRMFINFRFDKIPNYPFLVCVLDCNGRIPYIVRFELSFHKDEPLEDTIRSHFEELELNRRMLPAAKKTLHEIIVQCQRKHDLDEMKMYLQDQLITKETVSGINHWEASVYRAVIKEDRILKLFLK